MKISFVRPAIERILQGRHNADVTLNEVEADAGDLIVYYSVNGDLKKAYLSPAQIFETMFDLEY